MQYFVNVLCTPIAKISNLSINLVSFPDKCKAAKIKPLHKKGLETDSKNFRAISLLPPISKIIERIIHDQTINFLSDNNVLYKYQSENFTQQTLVCHTSMSKSQKVLILVSWTEWFLLIHKKRSAQLTTTF